MPRARTSGGSERIRFDAPRILKAPPRCRFSHLKKTRAPAWASKPAEVKTGVRRARGRMRPAAARTSAAVMARGINSEHSAAMMWGRFQPALRGGQVGTCPTGGTYRPFIPFGTFAALLGAQSEHEDTNACTYPDLRPDGPGSLSSQSHRPWPSHDSHSGPELSRRSVGRHGGALQRPVRTARALAGRFCRRAARARPFSGDRP